MADKEFYDMCYDAYMSGKNPDMVSEDAYDMMLDRGFTPDEVDWRDCYPNRGKQKTIEENEDIYNKYASEKMTNKEAEDFFETDKY